MRIAPILLLAVFIGSPASADLAPAPKDAEVIESLRGGGYNIYFRHAQTDWSQVDHVDTAGDWTSCDPSRMRQLSLTGIKTSRAIGDAIRSLDIPVGQVLASPYCRTVQTATLMDLGPVETTTDIMNLRAASFFDGRDAIVRTARVRLARVPLDGTNTILIAHGNVAREATPVYPDEAEAVIFKPDGNGAFAFFARIKAKHWSVLAQVLAHRRLSERSAELGQDLNLQ